MTDTTTLDKVVFCDFVVARHELRVQRELLKMLDKYHARYMGPGGNFISVVVSGDAHIKMLAELVESGVKLRTLARASSPTRAEEEACLILADPLPAICAKNSCPGGHSAVECPDCYHCKRRGHYSVSCPNKPETDFCFGCKQLGHMESRCPKKGTCHQCGRPGHLSMNAVCPDWSHAKYCSKCSSRGHLDHACQRESVVGGI